MMVENNDRNRIADFSKRALSLRSGFYYALFALLILVALIGGLTSAWFVTESENKENVFTAGTVNVQVKSPTFFGTEDQIDNWEPGQTLSTRYTFENAGTKTMYLRASFEGFWKKYYHRNTAKVIAYHNDTELVAYDSNFFYYGEFSPDYSPDYSPEATIGFFDDYVPSKLIFPSTQIESDFSNPNLLLNENANSTGSIVPELSENGNKCVYPPDDPKITIEKQISNIDSDNYLTSTPPVFNYLVTNTGNVPLTDITVEDDQFCQIGTISYLPVGASVTIPYNYNDWETELDTRNVSFLLCDQVSGKFNPSDWVYHNGYFYYLKPIASDLELELCVNVTLDSAGLKYDGAQFVLYSYFEAVQATNGLVHDNWDNPYPKD